MTDNEAEIRMIRRKEYTKLLDEKTNIDAKCYLLRKQNKELKALLERWQKENKVLQESLDGAEREIVKLVSVIENLTDSTTGSNPYGGD